MDNILRDVQDLLKGGNIKIANWVFQLHYQYTAVLLISFSVIVITNQFFDEPINCMSNAKYDDGVSQSFINNYCWIHSTFTLPRAYDVPLGEEFPHPGIDTRKEEDVPVYHAYYQWVGFFLFLQGLMFYVPKYLWSTAEKQRLQTIVTNLDQPLQQQDNAEYLWITEPRNQRKAEILEVGCQGINSEETESLWVIIDKLQIKTQTVGSHQPFVQNTPDPYLKVTRSGIEIQGLILEGDSEIGKEEQQGSKYIEIIEKGRRVKAKILPDLHQQVEAMKSKMNCTPSQSVEDRLKNDDLKVLGDYLEANLGKENLLVWTYLTCEVLSFINVLGQMFFTNKFLGGEFMTYGTQVLQFANTDQSNRTDPMIKIFPRVTKCSFRQYGPAGSVQFHDVLCILPINVINEKFFIFIWFWFVILAVITGLLLMYRILLIVSRKIRYLSIVGIFSKSKTYIQKTIDNSSVADWFLISLLKNNLNPMNFEALMIQVHNDSEGKKDD